MQRAEFRRSRDPRRIAACALLQRSVRPPRNNLDKHMAAPPLRPPARPAHDEWGVYDPEQAGLSALFAKLDSNDKRVDSPADKLIAQSAKSTKRSDLPDSH